MKKSLIIGILACFIFSFAQAQDFNAFVGKFNEIPDSGLLVGNMPSPKIDASLNNFVGADVTTKVLPIGKISTEQNIVYVFYITIENIETPSLTFSMKMQAFSTLGKKEGDEQPLSFSQVKKLEEAFADISKYQILPNTADKMKFVIVQASSDHTNKMQMQYNPEKKIYRIKGLN